MRRIIGATGIAAALLAAVAVAAALGMPRAAQAQGTEDETPPAGPATLSEILADLVADDVINQQQAERIEEAVRERGGLHRDRFGHGFRRPGGFIAKPDLAAIVGLEPEQLRDALVEGKTLAEIADETEGVTRQDLVDALVEAGNARIDAALEADRISEERAAELRERVEQHAEDLVDGEYPERGFPGRGFRGSGHPGFGPLGPAIGEDPGTA